MKPSVEIVKKMSQKTGNWYYVIRFKCGDFEKDMFPEQIDSQLIKSFMESYEKNHVNTKQ